MKERQRWQPEEDALLRNYVEQFGAKDWGKVSERTGKALDRDAKSCMERWKNYLKPGIKKTPLTQEEKLLIISLQEKYGNKWKKIAAEVPGRTAKRLGKWWEVHKEKEKKNKERQWGASLGDESANYNELFKHIAEKLDHRQVGSSSSSVPAPPSFILQHRLFTPASCVLGSSTMEPDLFSPQALYLRQQTPLSVGSTSSSSSVNTTSLPVATPFNFETDETKAIGAISSCPEARPGEIQDAPSFPLVSPSMQSGSRETSSLPPWMSTLPSTSGSVKMFPNFGGLHQTHNQTHKVGSSHHHGDRFRHLSVGLSLASSPSPGDGADESSPNRSLDMGGKAGLTNNTRSSGAQELGSGQRASWCPAQPTLGRISSGLMDEVRMRNFYPKTPEDLIEYWKELDEKSRLWSAQRKEDSRRLKRMKRQMVEEKLAKGRKKAEEVDFQTEALRVEQRKYLEHLEYEYWEKVEMMEREAEAEDSKRFDEWIARQQQIIQEQTRFLEEWNRRSKADG